jgi:hypothetical protein
MVGVEGKGNPEQEPPELQGAKERKQGFSLCLGDLVVKILLA